MTVADHQSTPSAAASAIVTGAGSRRGIGRATALTLAGRGLEIAVLDIDQTAAEDTASQIESRHNTKAIGIAVDVTDEASVAAAVACAESALAPVTVLANIAGISAPTRFDDIPLREWEHIFAVNVTGTFLVTRAVVPGMRARKFGRIINMASVSGQRGGGVFGATHYSASKAAVLGLTKALAREVGADGITVNAVAPGLVDTDITAGLMTEDRKAQLAARTLVGRLATPDDIANAIAFLALPESGYITGAAFDVNGGLYLR